MLHMMILTVPRFLDTAVEFDLLGQLRSRQQPALPTRQPVVRQFGLPSVYQLLAEYAVLIQQRIPDRRNRRGSKSVEKAGSQPPKPTVAEPGIRLQLVQRIELHPVFLFQQLLRRFGQIQIIQAVLERTTHEEFHTQVIHLLGLLFLSFSNKLQPLIAHQVAQYQRQRIIYVFVGGILRLHRKVVQQLGGQAFRKFLAGNRSAGLFRQTDSLFFLVAHSVSFLSKTRGFHRCRDFLT